MDNSYKSKKELQRENDLLRQENERLKKTVHESQKLQISNSLAIDFNHILNSVLNGISILDPELNILWTNEWIKQWYPESLPLEGKKCYQAYQHHKQSCTRCPALRSLKTGEREFEILPGPPQKTNIEWVECYSYPIKDPQNENIIAIIEIVSDITQRQKALHALQKSENKYKRLFETTGTATCIFNDDAYITLCNAEFERLSSFTEREIIANNKKWSNFVHPDDLKTMNQYHQERSQPQASPPQEYEFTFLDKYNNAKYVHLNISLIPETKERIASLTDMTNIKEIENSLRESEENLEVTLQSIGDAVITTNINGDITRMNPVAEELTGWKHAEALHQPLTQIFHIVNDKTQKPQENPVNKVIKKGVTERLANHTTLISKNGEKRQIADSGAPIYNKNGTLLGVILVFRDVTSEYHLRTALQESEKKFRELTELLPQTVYETDLNGNFTYTNQHGLKFTGYTFKDFEKGVNIHDLVIPEEKPKAQHNINLILKGEHTMPNEYHLKCKDGSVYPVLIYSQPIIEKNETTGIRGIVINISHQKQIQQDLKAAKDKAEESDRLKSAFLANVSHEIRTPMNGILGFSELLKDPGLPSDKKEQYLDIISSNGKHLLHILDDVIDISKIESHQMKIDNNECNLNALLEELYTSYYSQVQLNPHLHLQMHNNLPAEKAIIYTDETRLRQILSNLINNSLKFTEKGEIEIGVDLIEETVLKFYVKDTGIGIPKDMKKSIFEQFRQVDESHSRKYGGTGIGLTLSQKLVQLMGGEIWADSVEGEGSSFYFVLPYYPVTEKTDVSNSQEITQIPTWDNKTILVIEDDHTSLLYIQALLEHTNINILSAKDGETAIQLFKQHQKNIDAVLLDIRLPDLSGYEVIKTLKENNDNIPIIAQTAYAMKNDRQKCLDAGFDDYISKPFKLNTLIKVLQNYIS